MAQIVDTLIAIDDLLNQAIEIAHALPESAAAATYRDQQEAMVHRVSIRLGILEQVLILDRRIQELKELSVDVPEQDIPDLNEQEIEYLTALIQDDMKSIGRVSPRKAALLANLARLNQRAHILAEAMNRNERKEG